MQHTATPAAVLAGKADWRQQLETIKRNENDRGLTVRVFPMIRRIGPAGMLGIEPDKQQVFRTLGALQLVTNHLQEARNSLDAMAPKHEKIDGNDEAESWHDASRLLEEAVQGMHVLLNFVANVTFAQAVERDDENSKPKPPAQDLAEPEKHPANAREYPGQPMFGKSRFQILADLYPNWNTTKAIKTLVEDSTKQFSLQCFTLSASALKVTSSGEAEPNLKSLFKYLRFYRGREEGANKIVHRKKPKPQTKKAAKKR